MQLSKNFTLAELVYGDTAGLARCEEVRTIELLLEQNHE